MTDHRRMFPRRLIALQMAKLIPSLLLSWVAMSLSVPTVAQAAQRLRPQGLVNDFAGVMDPQAAQQLESVLLALERQTGAEVALVTVPTVSEGDIERAAPGGRRTLPRAESEPEFPGAPG